MMMTQWTGHHDNPHHDGDRDTDDDSDDIDQIVGVSANTVIPKALHRQGRWNF